LAFRSDSELLLTAVDGRARLWDTTTGQPIGVPMGRAGGPPWPNVVGGAAPRYVALTDGRLEVWTFDVEHYREMACKAAGRNLSQHEWALYGPPGEQYHTTCDQWPAPYTYCSDIQSCASATASQKGR
jgi:hypothetical protein